MKYVTKDYVDRNFKEIQKVLKLARETLTQVVKNQVELQKQLRELKPDISVSIKEVK